MVTSIASTLCGALFGGFQNYLEHKQDSTREIQLAKIQADKEIQIASQQTVISENQSNTQASITEQEGFKTESSLKQKTGKTSIDEREVWTLCKDEEPGNKSL